MYSYPLSIHLLDRERYIFSGSYVGFGTIRSEWKQLQYGRMYPAIVDTGRTVLILRDEEDARKKGVSYEASQFWMGCSPILVDVGKPRTAAQMRQGHPTLQISTPKHRVVFAMYPDGSYRFFLFENASLPWVAEELVKCGVWRAVNLDGGSAVSWKCDNQKRFHSLQKRSQPNVPKSYVIVIRPPERLPQTGSGR